jgi:hypothetical protein
MPTMQEMRRLNAEGKLVGPQRNYFLKTKPIEELYDTVTDPHEVKNLADDPKYKDVLERMRKVHQEWMKQTRDIGLIPEPEFDEMKWPGGKWQKTAEPIFQPASKAADKEMYITITCATTGASIAYKISNSGNKKTSWELYTKPVLLKPGQLLHARACRIGFTDSDQVQFKLGDKPATTEPPVAGEKTPHWKDQLNKTDLLERLWKIKALDGLGEKAVPEYFKALRDKYASVRYWAVIGLHSSCKESGDLGRAKDELRKMLKDSAAVVRIAAAEALCSWGEEKEGLLVLVEELKDKTDTARLYAVIALGRIGEKARPALPQIKAALDDPSEYVQRVARAALKRLESK